MTTDTETLTARACAFTTPGEALDYAERARFRVRVHYGGESSVSPEYTAGQDWGDVHDVAGYVGRSMGTPGKPETKARLIVANARSTGGPAMLSEDRIVRVRFANRREGGDLYRHPDYLPPSRWDSYPLDIDAHRHDWARHFAADPQKDPRGVMLDRLTETLRASGSRYALRIEGRDHRGSRIAIDTEDGGGTLAIVAGDGSALRYWDSSTTGKPDHLTLDNYRPETRS